MAMKCLNCDHERLRYNKQIDSYVCLQCGYSYAKQYFFISHSHLDIEKVRIIRNVIEETFFYEPILFFLKCLSDENELQDLIYREISERIWFVYCKSENAEKSVYVQQERKYLQELLDSGKRINVLEIELDKFEIWDKECHDYLRSQIAYRIRTSKVFISYSRPDRQAAYELYDEFAKRGFSVWQDSNLMSGSSWMASISDKIKQNSYKDGVFLLLISPKSMQNQFIEAELNEALACGAYVVPVLLCETDEEKQALLYKLKTDFPDLSDRRCVVANPNNSKTVCDKIIKSFDRNQ